ncbi:MAG TPA: metallophosphoesterase [Clostridia bacterium]|nr:metallophosphoesterase [Clostridia bacterium]
MRFVHLSDFHLDKKHAKDIDTLVNALITDLKEFNESSVIDAVFFTGDLIDKGGKSFAGGINEAFQCFERQIIKPVITNLCLDKNKFIFVPGNHDIKRDEDSEVSDNGMYATLKDINKVNEHIDSLKDEGIKRILPFKDFETNYYNGCNSNVSLTKYQSIHKLDLGNTKVGINALNTAWRCYGDEDNGRLLLGLRQITDASDIIRDCDYRIALMHHQIDFLAKFEQKAVESYLQSEYDILLCGHVHTGSTMTTSTIYGNLFISIAPTNSSENIWQENHKNINGYSIIDCFPGKVIVHNRIYNALKRKYESNIEISDNKESSGCSVFTFENKKAFRSIDSMNIGAQDAFKYNINMGHNIADNIGKESSLSKKTYKITTSRSISFVHNTDSVITQYLYKISKRSKICAEIMNNVDLLFSILDRFLFKIYTTEENKSNIDKITNLNEIIESIKVDQELNLDKVAGLFEMIDWWLNICKNHILSIRNNDKIVSNIDTIDLFISSINSRNKIEVEEDEYINILKSTKTTLDIISNKDDYLINKLSIFDVLSQFFICLLCPIYIYLYDFKRITDETIIRGIETEDTKLMLNSINNEYEELLNVYKPRYVYMNELEFSMLNNKVTVIIGEKNSGKSSILAASIKRISKEKYDTDISTLFFLHSFRYSKNIPEMIKSIIEQCNQKLINKIELDSLYEEYFNGIRSTNIWDNMVWAQDNYQFYKDCLSQSLKKFKREYTEAFIIIDSLDLVAYYTTDIIDLLASIPDGFHAVVVTDNNNEITSSIDTNNGDVHKINIRNINRDEVDIFTGLSDSESNNKEINDTIFNASKGNIKKITDIMVAVSINGSRIDISEIDRINNKGNEDFEEKAEFWLESDFLEDILLLLALFEPVETLTLENFQSFLVTIGSNFRLPRIRKEIKKANNFLYDVSLKRVKLKDSDFSKYIVQNYFSKRDLLNFIELIFKWFVADSAIELSLCSNFIKYLNNSELINKRELEILISNFIDECSRKNESERLFHVGISLFSELKDNKISYKIIEESIKLGNVQAMTKMGLALINGKRINLDVYRGEKLLIDASCKGDLIAKRILGNFYLEGYKVSQDIKEGRKLLEEAISLGSEEAKLDLTIRLLFGRDIQQDIKNGEKLLYELMEKDNADAQRLMGNRYILGSAIKQNVEKGIELLTRAMEKGNSLAKIDLAEIYITGEIIKKDVEIATRYLKELIKDGNSNAKRFYANYLIGGVDEKQSITDGINMLEELVDDGDKNSIIDYATYLLEGNVICKDVKKAVQLLEAEVEKENEYAMLYLADTLISNEEVFDLERSVMILETACKLGYEKIMAYYGNRLVYGIDIEQDITKGTNILKEAINKGSVEARGIYASSMLKGNKCDEETRNEAKRLLEEASFLGDSESKRYLARLLIEGDVFDRNTILGQRLLEEAIMLGNTSAMRDLGYRLLFGVLIEKNIYKGEELLEMSIKMGNTSAKTTLGYAILCGETDHYTFEKGIELLEDASKTHTEAKRILGGLLLKGEYLQQDKIRGGILLSEAIEENDTYALLILGNMLLDGEYMIQNKEGGIKYIEKSIELGNETAAIEYANRLIDGEGLLKDPKQGVELLEKIADKGNKEAKCDLGLRMISGDGIPQNSRQGENILRKLESEGYERARRILAKLIIEKKIDERVKGEGIELIEKAISNNDELSTFNYAIMLLDGEKVDKNITRGKELLKTLVKRNNPDAMTELGSRMLFGRTMQKDIETGVNLLKKATSCGNQNAKFRYSLYLIEGEAIEEDIELGIKMIEELISDGYMLAQAKYANMLILGDKIPANQEKGIMLYEELLKKDYINGIIAYSELLLDGIFIKKDIKRGETLMKMTIQKGSLSALYKLALRYLNGEGVRKHIANGKERLIKASSNGHINAIFDYGIRLIKGKNFEKNERKGKEYIRIALEKADNDEMFSLGLIAYHLKEYELATRIFFEAYIKDIEGSANSLAYMLRRGEIQGDYEIPTLSVLQEEDLNNNKSEAIINYALSLVSKNSSEDLWKKADSYIMKLKACVSSALWWYEISKKGDLEGDLVIGWLVRNKVITDPDRLDYITRFKKLIDNGWSIPKWMLSEPCIQQDFSEAYVAIAIEADKKKM